MNNWRIINIVKFILIVLLIIALLGFVLMHLWNWLMPELFGLKMISYPQALGILLLCKILFGLKPGGPGQAAKERWKGSFLRKRWEKKIANLSPEEKEKLKSEYKKSWSGWCGDEDPTEDPLC